MDLVSVDSEGGDSYDIGGFFYTDTDTTSLPGFDNEPSTTTTTTAETEKEKDKSVTEIGSLNEHGEIEEAYEDYKIVSEIRPTDVYVLQKMRNAVIVPTYTMGGEAGRKIGAPVLVEGGNAREYSKNLDTIARGCFPDGSSERALEVIY